MHRGAIKALKLQYAVGHRGQTLNVWVKKPFVVVYMLACIAFDASFVACRGISQLQLLGHAAECLLCRQSGKRPESGHVYGDSDYSPVGVLPIAEAGPSDAPVLLTETPASHSHSPVAPVRRSDRRKPAHPSYSQMALNANAPAASSDGSQSPVMGDSV